jgi:hypothetical protein
MKAFVALCLAVGLTASLHGATPAFAPAPGSPLKIPGGGYNFSLGDVNGDKKPDLIVVNDGGLNVMFGSGTGRFEPAPISAIKTAARGWRNGAG